MFFSTLLEFTSTFGQHEVGLSYWAVFYHVYVCLMLIIPNDFSVTTAILT